MRVLLITNILAPYRIPLYNLVNMGLEKEGFKFKIAFLAENEENRAWRARWPELKAEARLLPGWHKFLWRFEFAVHLNSGIWEFLRRENPDVIISGGYSTLANWIALTYSKRFKKPLILWTSTTKESVERHDCLHAAMRAFFIRRADAFVTYGKGATEYLLGFGIKPERVFTGCNVGDVEFYKRATAEYRKSVEFAKMRESLRLPVIIYVGQFIRRKGLLQLIEAVSGLNHEDWSLLLVGGGPMQPEVEKQVKAKNLSERITFVGFQEREDLSRYYAVADILVIPSLREPFAIVVSEAMASGLFVVASRYDGAIWDLIEEGRNGLIVDPADVSSLREGIRYALDTVKDPRYSREEIIRSIEHLSLERYAHTFINAVKYVNGKGLKNEGLSR
ncbi:MAG TPA: glycosyltransferase [Candidatus Saccharicenans sp.]|nr:glycosyltransferase [Candidatus Saccharicenans sp.]